MVELSPMDGSNPPASTHLPTFLPLSLGNSILFTRHWAQYGALNYMGIMRSYFQASPPRFDLMYFGTRDGNDMQGAQAIYH